jgi:hypothetical protein
LNVTNFLSDQIQRFRAFNAFVEEREAIRIKKAAGLPRPWSADPIFQEYKFCNVHREDDRTTQWIRANWRNPNIKDPDMWFAMVIARRALNWPGSMEALGYPVPWDPKWFLHVMDTRAAAGLKCYDTAYQLLVQGQKGDKARNMVNLIFNPLWEAREQIRPRVHDTLRSFFDRLSAFKYMGSFYTGQVVADVKYAQLMTAPDWTTFAVPGPGSERGLNRVFGMPKDCPWREDNWQRRLVDLHGMTKTSMHAQDLQNCLCEFDKYERIRLGEGRVRPYHPTV